MRRWICAALVLTSASATNAQTPYAGMQTRSIKALSEQQVADLGAGRGMGLALAAELNGYPGPSHVLELADKLNLSTDQRAGVRERLLLEPGRVGAADGASKNRPCGVRPPRRDDRQDVWLGRLARAPWVSAQRL